VVRGGVHNIAIVPAPADFSAHPLCGFYANPQRLLCVREISVVEDTEQDDRGVFLENIDLHIRCDPRRDQKRECWDPTDLASMKIMDLNESLLITERVDFPDVGIARDELLQPRSRFKQVWFKLLLIKLSSDHGNDVRHS
jgi:hypothetical protein